MSSSSSSPPSFWSPSFWLIGDITWQNLTSTPEMPLPDAKDIAIVPWITILLLILRKVVEKTIAAPLGLALGISPRKPTPKKNYEENPILEKLFHSFDRSNAVIASLSAKTDLSSRQIQSWLRRRQKFADFAAKPQLIDKFQESGWRLFFYLFIFTYGVVVLWDKPWTWSTNEFWSGWPHHRLEESIRWYYIIEAAFYCSLMYTQFTDVKRKDFWQMFIHHIVTLSLMFASWFTNLVRVGSVVLVLHDAVDWILESTKMSAYTKRETLSTILVTLFGSVWFGTRLLFFPLRVIRSCAFESLRVMDAEGHDVDRLGGIFYIFISCLIILFILHAWWFYKIVLLAIKVAKGESGIKDNRSESEESEELEPESEAASERD